MVRAHTHTHTNAYTHTHTRAHTQRTRTCARTHTHTHTHTCNTLSNMEPLHNILSHLLRTSGTHVPPNAMELQYRCLYGIDYTPPDHPVPIDGITYLPPDYPEAIWYLDGSVCMAWCLGHISYVCTLLCLILTPLAGGLAMPRFLVNWFYGKGKDGNITTLAVGAEESQPEQAAWFFYCGVVALIFFIFSILALIFARQAGGLQRRQQQEWQRNILLQLHQMQLHQMQKEALTSHRWTYLLKKTIK